MLMLSRKGGNFFIKNKLATDLNNLTVGPVGVLVVGFPGENARKT